MKNYQLIGRKKIVARVQPKLYPALHLHSLPYEILLNIFQNVASSGALVAVAAACRKFHNIVCKNFLYKNITFLNTAHFLLFASAHLPRKNLFSRRLGLSEPSSMINYIRSVHFVNPPTRSKNTGLTQIAGSYSIQSVNDGVSEYTDFLYHFKLLLTECYGLKEVHISEISPQFAFPPDFGSDSKNKFKQRPPKRHIEKIVLTAQSGWTIPFKLDHVSVLTCIYDSILVLQLNKFVVNESKLFSDAFTKKFEVAALVVSACLYSLDFKHKKRPSHLLAQTNSLVLQDILHEGDLTLIDFVKTNERLSSLSLDLNSPVFYHLNSEKKSSFNFTRFNNFFKLVCSGSGSYASLKLLTLFNFDLFYYYTHLHQNTRRDSWVAPPTNTFEYFLRFISEIPNLAIKIKQTPQVMSTCVKCGFKQLETAKSIPSLLHLEWEIVLAPLLENKNCSVSVYNHNGTSLYSRKRDPQLTT